MPPEVKALKSLTNEHIKDVMDILLFGDIAKLEELAEGSDGPLRALYAAGILRAIREGDPGHLEVVLNRILGKPKESIEHSGKISLEDLVAGANDPGATKD